jgi:hypothetical protein
MAAKTTLNADHTGEAHTGELVSAGSLAYRRARVAIGLRSAAHGAGVELTHSYATRIATDGIKRCGQLGVTQLGEGVVIHTAPPSQTELPVVLGYADAAGEWLRDGTRHDPQQVEP